jgi:hypothetical protein
LYLYAALAAIQILSFQQMADRMFSLFGIPGTISTIVTRTNPYRDIAKHCESFFADDVADLLVDTSTLPYAASSNGINLPQFNSVRLSSLLLGSLPAAIYQSWLVWNYGIVNGL